MGVSARRCVAALLVLCCGVVVGEGCSARKDPKEGKDLTLDGGGDGSGGITDNPCSALTQAQWEALFGPGARKGNPAGDAERCGVTSNGAPRNSVSFTDVTTLRNRTFDDVVDGTPTCSASPTPLRGVGDRAVIDTSCAATNGQARVIIEDGGYTLVLAYDAGGPAPVDDAAIATTLTEIARRIVAGR